MKQSNANASEGLAMAAEFESAELLVRGAKALRARGYRRLATATPYPVPELDDVLELRSLAVPIIASIGAGSGIVAGYFLQYYAAVISYPLDVGGRPLNSIPAFVPVTFEGLVLFGSLAVVIGLFVLLRLPRLHQARFEVPGIERASIDRFYLLIDSDEAVFDPGEARDLLAGAGASRVMEVPR